MPCPRKETDKFLRKAQSYIKKSDSRWRLEYDLDAICLFIASLPSRELSRVVSDPYWDRYPTWRYNGGVITKETCRLSKRYGPIIQSACQKLKLSDEECFDLICKKSTGLWAMYCIDRSCGKQRINLCKRVYKNKDPRVRLRAAKYLPIRFLKKMSDDPHVPVRNQVIKRVGVDNCAPMFLNDKSVWIKKCAIESSPIDMIDYLTIIDKYRSSAIGVDPSTRTGRNWIPINEDERLIPTLLEKIPKEDLPYFLDLISLASTSWSKRRIEEIIKLRMS